MSYGIEVWRRVSNNLLRFNTNIYNIVKDTGYNCNLSADTITGPIPGITSNPLKMVVTGTDPHIMTYSADGFSITPAQQYETFTFSVYVKVSRSPLTVQLYIFGADQFGNANIDNSAADFGSQSFTINSTNWTRISFAYQMRKSTTKAVQVRLDGNDDGAAATIWWDCLQVEKGVSTPTAFNTNTSESVLSSTMFGGRIFLGLMDAYNINSKQFTDVPSAADIQVYTLRYGFSSYDVINTSGGPTVTFSSSGGNRLSDFWRSTVIAIFATKVNEPEYGISILNDSGQRLSSTNYPVPVFIGEIFLNKIPSYTVDNSNVHEARLALGSANSNKLIVWSLPETNADIYYTGTSYSQANLSNNDVDVELKVFNSSSSTDYPLPRAYVFQLDNISSLPSVHTDYGLQLFNSQNQKTFDSGLQHMSVAGLLTGVNFASTESNKPLPSSLIGAPLITFPQYAREESIRQTSSYKNGALIYEVVEDYPDTKIFFGGIRSKANQLYYKEIYYTLESKYTFAVGEYVYANRNNNSILVLDGINYAAVVGIGTGNFSAEITKTSGSSSCSYDSRIASNCSIQETFQLNITGSNGNPISYNWSIEAASAGSDFKFLNINNAFTNTTSQSSAILVSTASATVQSCTLVCNVSQANNAPFKAIYSISRSHNQETATAKLVPDKTTYNEGDEVKITINTTAVPNGTTLSVVPTANSTAKWDLTDFDDSTYSTVTIYNNTAQITRKLRSDEATEGNEKLSLQLRYGTNNIGDPSAEFTINDTSNATAGWTLVLSDNTTTIDGNTTKVIKLNYSGTLASLPTYAITSSSASLSATKFGTGTMGGTYNNITKTYSGIWAAAEITAVNISVSETVTATATVDNIVRQTLNLTIKEKISPTATITISDSVNTSTTSTITFELSEDSNNFVAADITVSAGSITNFAGSGKNYSANYTSPSTAQTVTISIAAGRFTDIAGNLNIAASKSITVQVPTSYKVEAKNSSNAVVTSLNEGNVLKWVITTTGVPDNTTLYYKINGTGIRNIDYWSGTPQTASATTYYTQDLSLASGYANIINNIFLKYLGRYPSQADLNASVLYLLNGNTVEDAIKNITTGGNKAEYEALNTSVTTTGSLKINSNTATVSGILVADNFTEGDETATFNLYTDSTLNNLQATASVKFVDFSKDLALPTITTNIAALPIGTKPPQTEYTITYTATQHDILRLYYVFTDTANVETIYYYYYNGGTSKTIKLISPNKFGKIKFGGTIANSVGTVNLGQTGEYLVGIAPTANFTASPTSGYAPLTVSFTDTSTNSPTSWAWDFDTGTGTTTDSTLQNPSNTYTAGNYTVKLTATNIYGSSTPKTATITVTNPPALPVANFTINPTQPTKSGTIVQTVTATDSSTGPITSRTWNIYSPNNSSSPWATLTSTNIALTTLDTLGTWTITLTVTNYSGSSTISKNFTVVIAIPVANFTATPTTGDAPLTVSFRDTSTNSPTSWAWDFDTVTGTTTDSTLQNPSNTYTAGTYTVKLTATNSTGSGSKTATITVTNPPALPVSSFTLNKTEAVLGTTYAEAVTATDTSTGEITSWTWKIYKPNVSGVWATLTSKNITLTTLDTLGTWYIQLIVANRSGSSIIAQQSVEVIKPKPVISSVTISPSPTKAGTDVTFTVNFSANTTFAFYLDIKLTNFIRPDTGLVGEYTYASVIYVASGVSTASVKVRVNPNQGNRTVGVVIGGTQVSNFSRNWSISAYVAPVASFTLSSTSVSWPIANLYADTVTATNTSTNFTSNTWTITRPTGSVFAYTYHTDLSMNNLDATGTWTLTLTVADDYNSSSTSKTFTISRPNIPAPVANFTLSGVPATKASTSTYASIVTATNTSTNFTSNTWTITRPTGSVFAYTYHKDLSMNNLDAIGTWSLTLTVTNSAGVSNSITKTFEVQQAVAPQIFYVDYDIANGNKAKDETGLQVRLISLTQGQRLQVGTGPTGATWAPNIVEGGDTYIRLTDSSDVQLTYSDDVGTSRYSYFTYTAPATGFYKIWFGAYVNVSAKGKGAYRIDPPV